MRSYQNFCDFDEKTYETYRDHGLRQSEAINKLSAIKRKITTKIDNLSAQDANIETPLTGTAHSINELLSKLFTALYMAHGESTSILDLLLIRMRINDLLHFNNEYYQAVKSSQLDNKSECLAAFLSLLAHHSGAITQLLDAIVIHCTEAIPPASGKAEKIIECKLALQTLLEMIKSNCTHLINIHSGPTLEPELLTAPPDIRRAQDTPQASTPRAERKATPTHRSTGTLAPVEEGAEEGEEEKEEDEQVAAEEHESLAAISLSPTTQPSTASVGRVRRSSSSLSISLPTDGNDPILTSPAHRLVSQSHASVLQPFIERQNHRSQSALAETMQAIKKEPPIKKVGNITFWAILCGLTTYALPYFPWIWGFASATAWGAIVVAAIFVAAVAVTYLASKFLPALFSRIFGSCFPPAAGKDENDPTQEISQRLDKLTIQIGQLGKQPRVYNQFIQNVEQQVVLQPQKTPRPSFQSPTSERINGAKDRERNPARFTFPPRSESTPNLLMWQKRPAESKDTARKELKFEELTTPPPRRKPRA